MGSARPPGVRRPARDLARAEASLASEDQRMRGVLAVFGLILVGFGVLVLVFPQVLTILIAAAFILFGLAMVLMAISSRGYVTYRAIGRPMGE
jgi:hypothetical protein